MSDSTFPITAVSTGSKQFTVTGDFTQVTSLYAFPLEFAVKGSTGNDGIYTVTSAVYSSPSTVITVSETVVSSVADGNVFAGKTTGIGGALYQLGGTTAENWLTYVDSNGDWNLNWNFGGGVQTPTIIAYANTNKVEFYGDVSAGASLAFTTTINTVTATELSYVHGVTSPIQTQLNNKLSSSSLLTNFMKAHVSTGFTSNFTQIVPFDVADVDYLANLNTTTHRYTPTAAGYYKFFLNVVFNANTANTQMQSIIYKNGTQAAVGFWTQAAVSSGSTQSSVCCETIEYMNGSSDYVEFWYSPLGFSSFAGSSGAQNTICTAHRLI